MHTTQLPNGFQALNLKEEHEQGVVDVINAHYRWMNGGNLARLKEMQADWREEGFDRDTDTQVVLDETGKVVGYADVWNVNAMNVRLFSLAAVDPERMGCGIGTHLAQWAINHARQKVDKAPEGARVVLQQSINRSNHAAYDLLIQNGYTVVRHSYRMRINLDQPPVVPDLPEGITIRPMVAGQEEKAAFWVAYDSFRDHWGHVEEPFEEYCKRWMYYIENTTTYDPSLYFVAMDGDQMAGVCLCDPHIEEDPGMAWVGTLGVLRPWRKRGLGLALLQHAFAEFYQRGIPRAGLGVDAENLTGALRLYEKAGMQVWRKNAMYEYELRPGKDLMTQSLE